MVQVRSIAVLVGSLRRDSVNRKAANAVAALAPPHLRFTMVPIGDLPLFSEDLEAAPPAAWVALREQIRSADAILFATPEYNRSIPAPLKNALDIASRPYGASVWDGKPAAVISASPGAIGGFGATHHLRQSLAFLNMAVLAQPEVYLSDAFTLFDDEGRIVSAGTEAFLKAFAEAFARFIDRVAPARQFAA